MQRLSFWFAAGAFGGLLNSVFIWLAGKYGLTAAIGVKIAPDLSPAWLYQRLVWGGIWGFIFILPLLKNNTFWRGVVLSLGPSLVQLLWVFPSKTPHGLLGLGLGQLTPLVVLVVNAVWGLAAAYWLRGCRK